MSSRKAEVTLPTDEQIQITREFDVPMHLVYEVWTPTDPRSPFTAGTARSCRTSASSPQR
jgi:uncharacterized protein YndB with AHSA1/START domain